MLEKSTHRLFIADGFEGQGEHDVRIPYTFAPKVEIAAVSPGVWRLTGDSRTFLMICTSPEPWTSHIDKALFSPSYGVLDDVASLVFERKGNLSPIAIALIPENDAPPDPVRWLSSIVEKRFPVPGFNR